MISKQSFLVSECWKRRRIHALFANFKGNYGNRSQSLCGKVLPVPLTSTRFQHKAVSTSFHPLAHSASSSMFKYVMVGPQLLFNIINKEYSFKGRKSLLFCLHYSLVKRNFAVLFVNGTIDHFLTFQNIWTGGSFANRPNVWALLLTSLY